MEDTYVENNAAERRRLVQLTGNRSEADLARRLGEGWTVATKLLHLAFWDLYAAALLRRWKRTGLAETAFDTDALNEAIRALSEEIPPRAAVRLAQTAAAEVDGEAEGLTPELKAAIEKAGRTRAVCRSLHRRAHLDQIAKVLGE